MPKDSKMIMPPYYSPTDRDIAIQLVGIASQLLNRKYNKWDMPPVILPMEMDSREKERIRLSYLPPDPGDLPPPPDPDKCFPVYYPTDRDVAIQLLGVASQLLNRKHSNWDMPMPMMKPKEEA